MKKREGQMKKRNEEKHWKIFSTCTEKKIFQKNQHREKALLFN